MFKILETLDRIESLLHSNVRYRSASDKQPLQGIYAQMKREFVRDCKVYGIRSIKSTEEQVKDCFDRYREKFLTLFADYHLIDNWKEHLYKAASTDGYFQSGDIKIYNKKETAPGDIFVYEIQLSTVMTLDKWIALYIDDSLPKLTINVHGMEHKQLMNVEMSDGPNGSICIFCMDKTHKKHHGILVLTKTNKEFKY